MTGPEGILAALFPTQVHGPPERSRHGWRAILHSRWSTAVVVVVALAAGTAASLLRQAGAPAVDTLWAEDGGVFLQGAYRRSAAAALIRPYAGYWHLVPRLVGEAAALVPPTHAAVVIAVAAAFVAAGCGVLVWFATAQHLRSRVWRAVIAGLVVLQPVAALESLNSIALAQWQMLLAAFWLLLWCPAAPAHGGDPSAEPGSRRRIRLTDLAPWGAAVIVLLIGLSAALAVVLVPLALARLVVVRPCRHPARGSAGHSGTAIEDRRLTGHLNHDRTCAAGHSGTAIKDRRLTGHLNHGRTCAAGHSGTAIKDQRLTGHWAQRAPALALLVAATVQAGLFVATAPAGGAVASVEGLGRALALWVFGLALLGVDGTQGAWLAVGPPLVPILWLTAAVLLGLGLWRADPTRRWAALFAAGLAVALFVVPVALRGAAGDMTWPVGVVADAGARYAVAPVLLVISAIALLLDGHRSAWRAGLTGILVTGLVAAAIVEFRPLTRRSEGPRWRATIAEAAEACAADLPRETYRVAIPPATAGWALEVPCARLR